MSSPNLTVIDTLSAIDDLGGYLTDKDLVAFDTETTGLSVRDSVIGFSVCAEEDIAYYVITQKYDPDTKQMTFMPYQDEVKALLEQLKGKQLLLHNAVFDCKMINSSYKIDLMPHVHTDTMILAHLLNENRRVGLKDLATTYFGTSSTTDQQKMKDSIIANGGEVSSTKYELYKADPYLIGRYGAQDTNLTFKLFMQLVPELYEQGLEKFFYEEESMPLLRGATYQLNTVGLRVDTQRLASLKKQLEAECLEAKHTIMTEIAPHLKERYPGTTKKNVFNIGATQQLSWLLFGQLGLEFTILTDSGKELCQKLGLKLPYTHHDRRTFLDRCIRDKGKMLTPDAIINGKKKAGKKIKEPWAYIKCDKKALQKISHKYEWIKILLEYQRKLKLLNTYVEGISERVEYGVVSPSFLQHGTTSGRYASRDPNFQNLPRDDKRIKECIIARPGKTFVGADYSQLEPRVFAYFSGDQRLLAAFQGADDFYSVIGMEVYDKLDCVPRKDGSPDAFGIKYKKLRDLSKVIALASTYGATARQLASTTGKSVEETQEDIDNYFEKFPGVAQMMLDSHAMAKKDGFVTNLFGRKRRMPEAMKIAKMYGKAAHADLPYEVRNMLNLAVNHRIQSTGASICNRAMIKFLEDVKISGIQDCQLVIQVHDEIIAECRAEDAYNVSLLLQNAMETAVELPGVHLEAIPNIAENIGKLK